ncbi:hypothetical protein F4680DRAFT_441033 [Xylaria scruposa]|nr:hypothetical protein F4680DRAFT_441033 [Xylaria scruposa]
MSSYRFVARGAPMCPKFFVYVVGLIILLSIAVLALAAYAESLSGNYYYESDVPCFLLFVSIWTLLIYGGTLVIERCVPQFYYRIVFIIGQLLSVIFWITAWAWAASWASYTLSFDNYSSYDKIRGAWMTYGKTIAACAGIGAGVWVLCIGALIVFCSACKRNSTLARTNDMGPANISSSQGKTQPVYVNELSSTVPCVFPLLS